MTDSTPATAARCPSCDRPAVYVVERAINTRHGHRLRVCRRHLSPAVDSVLGLGKVVVRHA